MRAHVVDDLREVAGRWVLCATTCGYFDHRPNVEQATLEYRIISDDRMSFAVRFRMGGKERGFSARQSAVRSPDGFFRFRSALGWFRVARLNWDIALGEDGQVMVAANAGSLIAPVGLMVFARDGARWSGVNERLAVSHRDFGITSSQLRLLSWRSESRRMRFDDA